MPRFLLQCVIRQLSAYILVGLTLFSHNVSALNAKDVLFSYTVLGDKGAVARVITAAATCPNIQIDGVVSAMQLRAAPDKDFPVTVCDAPIPITAKTADINGQSLALPKGKPETILILGDTGCRLKGESVQGCNSTAEWPFSVIADSAAKTHPDLTIHVGDYFYRESPCLENKADCVGSPYGNNWASWEADFFTPASNLLASAPWVFVQGNHEKCARAGMTFFRFMDPRPMPTSCSPYTEPYAVHYMDPQLIVMDVSSSNDFKVEPEQLEIFTSQFKKINQMATKTSWLLMHAPVYAFWNRRLGDGKMQLVQGQDMLQYASHNTFSPSLQLLIAGHIHLFEVLNFEKWHPAQLIVGNGGSLIDPPVTALRNGLEIAGMHVEYSTATNEYGFSVMTRNRNHWTLSAHNIGGSEVDKCVLGGGILLCDSAFPKDMNALSSWFVRALLSTGNDSATWLALAIMKQK